VTTLAEDLVLLMIDPACGKLVVDSTALDRAVAGALLLDLALRERLAVEGSGSGSRLYVVDPTPTGEPVLDVALSALAGPPLRGIRSVERLAGDRTREPVLAGLERRGLARRRRSTAWGIFPTTHWQILDDAAHRNLREQLAGALLDGRPPDVRLVCLISLLHAVRAAAAVVDGPAREVRAAAAEIAAGERVGATVRNAVDGVRNVVVMAAFTAATRQRFA
jgi:hypothetical protein